MSRARSRKQARLALGAALAGILVGAAHAQAAAPGHDAGVVMAGDDADGCNGPNGCGGDKGDEDDQGKGGEPKASS